MLSSTRAVVRPSTTLTVRRAFATSPSTSSSAPKPPASRPGPPKLPRAEQREFERLVAAASSGGAFSTPPSSSSSSASLDSSITSSTEEDVHKDARRGPKPDFEGEKNPLTGEIGGPKKDPLLHREWTYGGRATDF